MTAISNKKCRLTLDETSGGIVSLSFNGVEMLHTSNKLFTLGFRDTGNNIKTISSDEFTCKTSESPEEIRLDFTGNKEFRELEVSIFTRFPEDSFLFRTEVRNVPEVLTLEWIEPLHLRMSDKKGKLFLARHEGILIDEPLKYTPYSEPEWHYYNHYPGHTQMQFMAYFTGKYGLYYGAHDKSCGPKALEGKPENGRLRMMIRNYCGCSPGASYKPDFEMALCPFEGDWMDGCEIYRKWIEKTDLMPPKGQMPAFVKESPVVLIYPVRGNGDDKGSMAPNEYYPYINAMPVARKLADEFASRVMPLLMHWEGTAPWAPPYVWPPMGGEQFLGEYRDALHAEGHYLGVYCSGTAWTQTSSITDYSREKQFQEEGLEKEMIRGPHGEIDAYICNGPTNQRIGYDMCVSQEWPRQTVKEEVRKLADFGLDYAQFFDQNIGGASHMCWSKEHNHPPVPGKEQTGSMLSLLEEIRVKKPGLTIGCEAAAADAYLKFLPFSDMRFACWDLSRVRPVPAYAYLFHEYLNNFMGNQCGIHWQLELEKCPDNLLWRTGYAFNSGDLLSVVLKDNGQIHWGWCLKWDVKQPEQENIIKLVRNLNSMRKRYPEFLQYGRMLKPLSAVSGKKWQLATTEGPRELDAFLHSSWQSADGRKAQFITNFLPVEQKVKISRANGTSTKVLTLPPLSAVIEGDEK